MLKRLLMPSARRPITEAELDKSSEFKFTNAQQVAFLVHFRQEKLNSIGIDHHDLSVN